MYCSLPTYSFLLSAIIDFGGDITLHNVRETSKVELFCTATAHLLSQPSGSERMHYKLLLLLSWIKKYIYSLWSHAGDLLHNGI